MSLLMEALRKAEEAKRKIQNHTADAASVQRKFEGEPTAVSIAAVSADNGLTLKEMDPDATTDYILDTFLRDDKNHAKSPARSPTARTFPLPDKPSRASVEELQTYLETTPDLEETLAAPHKDAPQSKLSPTAQQRAAGAVFAAKQKPVQSHTMRNTLLVLLALLVPLGGAVLWYFVTATGSSFVIDPAVLTADVANRSLSDGQIIEQPAAQPLQQGPAPVTAMTEEAEPRATNPELTTAPLQQTELPANQIVPAEKVADVTPAPAPVAPTAGVAILGETASTETPMAAAPETATANETVAANNPVQVLEVSHSKGTSNNNQQLIDAYTSLQAGDNASASIFYQQVLEQLPNNRDALLGSAAIAMREGDLSRAREYYSRLMQLNPKDPLARTGLLQTIKDIDPLQYEQELQRLLQQFPNVAPLSFALGNVYATQQRWNEAQSAYFDAFLSARQSNETSISPDYAYNLAISLEQINQPKAALDYYLQAQTLARSVTPGFDIQALSRRISLLEQGSP